MRVLPKIIWWLGYGGLLPFFILTGALLLGASLPFLENARLGWWLAAYAATVLTFIGAMHWIVALGMQNSLNERELAELLLFSVVPTMVAWFALLLPINITLFVLAGLIIVAYVADSVLLFRKLEPGYQKMRLHLSVIVTLLLLLAGTVAS